MNDSELEKFLADLEADRIERKSSVSDSDKIRQALCAFANDLPNHHEPGILFVGVGDDGTPTGLPITDELLRTLADMRSDGNILPPPMMSVQKRNLRGADMAVVIVQPSDAPPVRYKGRTWVRVGPRRATATAEEEKRLSEKRRSKDLPFELQPVKATALSDLDLDLFRNVYLPSAVAPEILAENSRVIEDQLASLRLVTPGPDFHPTTLGILALGRQPLDYIPCAYVQFLRIDGKELGDPIKDNQTIDGPLIQMLHMLDDKAEAHVHAEMDILTGQTASTHPDYPIVAIQQIIRNAVLHRIYEGTNAPVRFYWFDDRIEILSPGGPYGQVNRENFGQPGVTDYRNLHLGEIMRMLGYVQRFGFGIPLARRECLKNGNPEPEFVVEESHILAVLKERRRQ